jgi:hypothetical protein
VSGQGKVAKNLERFRQGVFAHDRENPDHPPAYGVGLSHFDLERLGFEDGETLWPGVRVEADGGQTGNFRVLCHGQHDEKRAEAEIMRAIGVSA